VSEHEDGPSQRHTEHLRTYFLLSVLLFVLSWRFFFLSLPVRICNSEIPPSFKLAPLSPTESWRLILVAVELEERCVLRERQGEGSVSSFRERCFFWGCTCYCYIAGYLLGTGRNTDSEFCRLGTCLLSYTCVALRAVIYDLLPTSQHVVKR
jgi:hypothetical protein